MRSAYPQKHVFVSYAHTDASIVAADVACLKSEGLDVWFDERIQAGRRWADELAHAIDNARAMLFYISRDSMESRHCLDEVAYALDLGLPIIGVYCESIDLKDGLRLSLARFHAIMRWRLNTDEYRQQLRHALQERQTSGGSRPRILRIDRPVWQVPAHRNPHFVGRETILQSIDARFRNDRSIASMVALTGLGGVGKTQIALEYAYRHADRYRMIAWINAEKPQTLAAGFMHLAHSMGLPEQQEQDEEVVIAAVLDWLSGHDGWLLVLDNVETRQLIQNQVPAMPHGHVLITSRRADWGSLAHTIPVNVLDEAEAVALVTSRLPQCSSDEATALVRMLDCLPLAIDESVAYVESTGRSITSYMELFAIHHQELLKQSFKSPHYPNTLRTTWEVSIQHVREQNPSALDLLELLAFFAPADVPMSLLQSPSGTAGTAQDAIALDMAVALLRSFSLINTDNGSISVHRLVQMITRDRIPAARRDTLAVAALQRVEAAFPSSGAVGDMRPECRNLLPHAIACLEHARGLDAAAECAGRLLGRTGTYLSARSWSTLGFDHLREAYELFASRAPGSTAFAKACELHGRNLYKLSRLSEAREVFEQGVNAYRHAAPDQQPRVAQPLTDLAWITWSQGDLAAARSYAQASIDTVRLHGPPGDPRELGGTSILARILFDQGDIAASRRVVMDALETVGGLMGLRHPLMGAVFIQLGQVLLFLGSPLRALSWAQESLALLDRAYGEHHPLVASAHCLLGQIYHTLGDYTAAVDQFEATRASTGAAPYRLTQHALVATPFLAQTLLMQGRTEDAALLLDGELPVLSARVGGDGAYLALRCAQARSGLALARGDQDTAIDLLEKSDRETRERFGDAHPFRIPTLNLLGRARCESHATPGARQCLDEALSIAVRHELADHPSTADTYLALADAAPQNERPRWLVRARDALRNSLGDAHERVAVLSDQTG